MPDVDERLDHVEQKLKDLGERIDEQFGRSTSSSPRSIERFDRVEGRIDSLAADVQKLQVLGERSESESSWSRRFRAIMERHFSGSTTPWNR